MSTILLRDRPRSLKEWQNVALLASAARTKVTEVTGTGVYIGDWDKLQIILDITNAATDASVDYLDVMIDMSMEG